MLRITELRLPLGHAPEAIRAAIVELLGIPAAELIAFRVARRANDARRKSAVVMVYSVDVALLDEERVLARMAGDTRVRRPPDTSYRFVAELTEPPTSRPVIIGAGPCGLFCALILAQMGLRPIIVERGKVVRERTQDTWGLWRRRELNPESNVQFGEGGAGTFSDGKLWSQIKDPRHLGRKVLSELVQAGAPAEILVEAHPHVGTFRLVTVVENLRRTIEDLGGEYRFGQRVDDFDITVDGSGSRTLRGLHLSDGSYLAATRVVLAVGHSARDTFDALHRRHVRMEAKPFSIGVRIEHPQSWIDRSRYGTSAGHPDLGAAAYALSHHGENGRTVYSFCMCPGGTVVAAASEPGRLVVNGMSQYSRNERNANAGLVVGIDPARDYPGDPLAGVAFQRHWEAKAFEAGGGRYEAPAQTVGDFLAGRASTRLGSVVPSYKPGVQPTDLARCLPDFVVASIREALPVFGRQIKDYDHPDAVLTGIEARTSSPVRIDRGADFQSLNTAGLYPAGEGAGYAGGILSAAVDGIRVAEAIALGLEHSIVA